jgi:hypothetical protein
MLSRAALTGIAPWIALVFSGCVTGTRYNKPIDPKASPSPAAEQKKPPPQPPEKHFEFECRVLNNEGRVFTARGSSETEAEGKALRNCRINYRRCQKISCDVVQVLAD